MPKKKKSKKVLICEYCKRVIDKDEKLDRCPICKKMLCLYHLDPKDHACEGVDWEKLEEERRKASDELFQSYLRGRELKDRLKTAGKILLAFIVLYVIYVAFLSGTELKFPFARPEILPNTSILYEDIDCTLLYDGSTFGVENPAEVNNSWITNEMCEPVCRDLNYTTYVLIENETHYECFCCSPK